MKVEEGYSFAMAGLYQFKVFVSILERVCTEQGNEVHCDTKQLFSGN
jgi:hypothetical protein